MVSSRLLSVGLLVASASHSCWGQSRQWQKTQLADSITVDFPRKPVEKNKEDKLGAMHNYIVHDSSALYVMSVQENALEPESNEEEIQEFYQGIVRGVGGRVVSKKRISIDGFTGIQLQFATPDRPNLPAVKFMQAFAVNGTAYMQQFWTNTETDKKIIANRRRFFESFHPKTNKTHQVVSALRANAIPYRIGKLIGKLIIFPSILAILVVAIWRVVKASRKRV